jgi:hypothetical protein
MLTVPGKKLIEEPAPQSRISMSNFFAQKLGKINENLINLETKKKYSA